LTQIFVKKYYFVIMATRIDCVEDLARASSLLSPLRLEILRLARQPVSASELSRVLKLPRQRVNYHVRQLAGSGFLRQAGRRRRRNMIEQRYSASADGYLLSPKLLGAVGADWRLIENASSADYMLALCCQMETDLSRLRRGSGEMGSDVSLSLKSQFRFENEGRRQACGRALREAVVRVIAEYTTPYLRPDGSPAQGQPYRLVLGCYPYLPEEPAGRSSDSPRVSS
jgi:DNA-binding transcriptional ArsR family regulator